MDKYKTLLDNTAIFTASRIGTKLIAFLLVPLYTAYLTTSELGTAELIVTTVDIAIPVLTLGIKNAVFRFSFDKDQDSREILKCFYYIFLFTTLLSAVISGILLSFEALKIYGKWFFFLTTLTAFDEAYGLYLKARDRTIIFAVDAIVYAASFAGLNIIFLVVLRFGMMGYLLAMAIAKFISISYMFVFGRETKVIALKGVDRDLLLEMIKYSFPLIANSLAWWAINYADRYMLGIQVSMAIVGIYTIASKIPNMVTTFNTIVMDAWVISYVNEHENIGTDERVFYSKVFEGYNVIITLLTSFIMLIIYPFMHIYVDKAYYDSIEIIPMLLIGALFLSYSSFTGVVFSAEKKSSVIMTSSLIAGAWNIALNFALIPRFEMYGAAIATMTAYMIMAVYRLVKASNYVRVISGYKEVISVVLLLIQMTAVTLKWNNYTISLIVIIMISVINYNSMKKTISKVSYIVESRFKRKK